MFRQIIITPMLLALGLGSAACSALDERPLFGMRESVFSEELGECYPAKIDTGAGSASLNAINIKLDKGPLKGDDVVHFDLVLPDNSLRSMSLPIVKYIRVQRRAADVEEGEKDYNRRPAVAVHFVIGGERRQVEINLADRRGFSYPLLVGAKPLRAFDALVDTSGEYLQGDCPASQQKDEAK